MSSITKTQAIKKFLTAFTHADLAELYSHDQEVQVNVSREDGNRIEIGEFKGRGYNAYTNGVLTWKPFRIPFNARTEPSYHDSPLTYPLELYADGIGMTGWDWANKCSRWVAFDFDAIVGHSDKHGKKLDDKQLQEIQDTVADVPFVTLRKSTSGKGLHLYVFLDPVVSTANHTEHAALARSILSMLSGLTSFDFASKVDTCGANMWVWHRKMYTDWNNRLKGDGLQLIKSGTKLSSVPANWRDHVGVVTQKSPKTIPEFVYNLGVDNPDKLFNELCGQRARVTLDTRHRELIDWLAANGACWWWDSDNHMLVTHTYHLKEAHTQLKLCGKFETIATGALRGNDHNCFSGDTEVLVKSGVTTLREAAAVGHAELLVKTQRGMEWAKCEVKSFGVQKTYRVAFGDSNYVRATQDHEWLQHKKSRIKTWQIVPGKTMLPLAPIELPEPDPEGYAHGFVYGDGWVANKGKHCDVALFKRDKDLQELLCKFGVSGSQYYEGHGYTPVVRQLPNTWKELPSSPSRAYALGFILGFVSADGIANSNLQIFQCDMYCLLEVRKMAIAAGLRVSPVRPVGDPTYPGRFPNGKQCYTISINTYNIKPEWILTPRPARELQAADQMYYNLCQLHQLERTD